VTVVGLAASYEYLQNMIENSRWLNKLALQHAVGSL